MHDYQWGMVANREIATHNEHTLSGVVTGPESKSVQLGKDLLRNEAKEKIGLFAPPQAGGHCATSAYGGFQLPYNAPIAAKTLTSIQIQYGVSHLSFLLQKR